MGWLRTLAGRADIHKAQTDPVKPTAHNLLPEPSLYGVAGNDTFSSGLHPGTMGLDYYTLMSVARVPVIGAILQTRINQIAEFCIPQSTPYSSGFRVKLRDRSQRTSPAAKKKIKELEHMMQRAGGQYGFGNLEASVRALMRDSLTYDQANFEIIRDKGGRPWGFVPVDASTIRRAKPTDKARRTGQYSPDGAAYVQIVGDQKVAAFSRTDMAWCVRRPRTMMQVNGYGYPELEELLRVVTDLLNATTYNSVNFTNGVHANTILALKSTMTPDTFYSFQRMITNMMTGVHNRGRVPIVQLSPDHNEEIKTVNLSGAPKDQEFKDWINYLMKIACAVYTMDPAELGFIYGNEGQNSAMNGANPEGRVIASKERGLRPLLRSLQTWFNQYLIYPNDEDFQFEFVGLDTMTEKDRIDLDVKIARGFKTINEVRLEHDLDPLPLKMADSILDSTFMSMASQELMPQEEPQEAPEGQGGEEGGEDMPEFGADADDDLLGDLEGFMDEAEQDDTEKGFASSGERIVKSDSPRTFIFEVS